MLLIPVAVVLVAGIVFLAILFSIISSNGFRFGEERFYDHKDEIMTLIGDCLDSDTPTDSLNGLIDSAGQANMRIIVAENGQILYEEGSSSASDEKLLAMTAGGEGLFVSDDIRQLYTATLVQGDATRAGTGNGARRHGAQPNRPRRDQHNHCQQIALPLSFPKNRAPVG